MYELLNIPQFDKFQYKVFHYISFQTNKNILFFKRSA